MIPLTGREVQLLEAVRDGATNRQAAFMLGVTEQTVKNHMTSAMHKLDAPDRTSAVMRAIQTGQIQLSSEPHYPTSIGACLDALAELERGLTRLMTLVAAVRADVLAVDDELRGPDATEAGAARAVSVTDEPRSLASVAS